MKHFAGKEITIPMKPHTSCIADDNNFHLFVHNINDILLFVSLFVPATVHANPGIMVTFLVLGLIIGSALSVSAWYIARRIRKPGNAAQFIDCAN